MWRHPQGSDATALRRGAGALRLALVIALVGLLVAAGCAAPEGNADLPSAPWGGELEELAGYADQRRTELDRLTAERPDDAIRAWVTLARPVPPAEAQALFHDHGVEPSHFEWRQVGTELRGGDGWTFLGQRAAEFSGLGVTYITAEARATDWRSLAADERVWLVDIGGDGNLFDHAVEAGLLPQP